MRRDTRTGGLRVELHYPTVPGIATAKRLRRESDEPHTVPRKWVGLLYHHNHHMLVERRKLLLGHRCRRFFLWLMSIRNARLR